MNGFSENFLLYEDNDLIVINKPPNLLSVADGYNAGLPHLKTVLEPHFGSLWIVHRLDKETSGAMIIARNADTHRQLSVDFQQRSVEKFYHGLVTPAPPWQENDIRFPLQPDSDRKHRTRVDPDNGKEAHTYCKIIKRFTLGVLMEMQIFTGIIHQIRAHLRSFDLVLFGESLYNAGVPPQPIEMARTMLHSRKLTFTHPTTKARLSLTAPYPEDFREAYTKLRFTTNPDGWI
jgi:RluA family pseudouridine synthase